MFTSNIGTPDQFRRAEKALSVARETKALSIGKGILHTVPLLFKEQFPNRKAVIIADSTTFELVGKTIYNSLIHAGIEQAEPYIFTTANLYAEYSFVSMLEDYLKSIDAIAIAVGSGTINDLTKLASHLVNRQYMCVATAASMDGYTAFGASITANGAKQTFNCPAPQVCLADIDIIVEAPVDMNSSGYADLFAKITAGADWILADALGVEPIDKQAMDIVQGGLAEALSNPKGVVDQNEETITQLIQGLMLGGFAMQANKTSRPASGAEHQFSHLWNMDHHTNKGVNISHGFQVAIGLLAVTAFYECVLNTPFQNLDIDACCEAWPTLDEYEIIARDMFRETDFPNIGVEEIKAKYIPREKLSEQLLVLKNNWKGIKDKLKEQLKPYEEAKQMLRLAGAPYEPEHIGVSRAYLRQSFIRAQFIRRRFTILDLAVRTNMMDKWLNQLFGKGCIWEIES